MLNTLAKYNFWNNNRLDLGYIRQEYLRQITKSLNTNLIKVIIGQRRTGKSYLLRQIIDYLIKEKQIPSKNTFYFTKEAVDFFDINTAEQLKALFDEYLKNLKPKGKIYIFLDEIQEIENWEKLVAAFSQDISRNYEVFITGSNSKLLSSELATYIAGRYIKFEVFPFSYEEYIDYYGLDRNKQTFMQYLQDTGMPEMLKINDLQIRKNYFSSLLDTIILRDIVSRYKVRDVALLKEIFYFLLQNASAMTSINAIVKFYKSRGLRTNYETVSAYVDYITNTFTVHQSLRYNIKAKQLLGAERKFYLNDLGFKSYLLGFKATDIEKYLENYVYLKLRRKGWQVYTGLTDQGEIDFVARSGAQVKYFQVCYQLADGKVINREFGNLKQIKDNFPKAVISADEIRFDPIDGIEHLRAWENL